MTSVYIVGNCHLNTMRRSLKLFDSALLVDGCHLWDLAKTFPDADALFARLRGFDHVLTSAFGENFLAAASSDAITRHLPQATLYPTITFGAFHPDVTYAFHKTNGSVLASPLGPYNSAIVLYGVRRGLDPMQTIALFNAATYERVGYLSAWNTAMEELGSAQEARDFDLPRMAHHWLRQGCFMHNPQHPKLAPMCDIARTAMERIGLVPRHQAAAPFLPDDLQHSFIWPVYPEIGAFYGIPGGYTFKRNTGPSRWPEFMTLEEFVLASYEVYRLQPLDDYPCPRVDHWLETGLDL